MTKKLIKKLKIQDREIYEGCYPNRVVRFLVAKNQFLLTFGYLQERVKKNSYKPFNGGSVNSLFERFGRPSRKLIQLYLDILPNLVLIQSQQSQKGN